MKNKIQDVCIPLNDKILDSHKTHVSPEFFFHIYYEMEQYTYFKYTYR